MTTPLTATTQFITASTGVRFAYRRLGPDNGIPLIMHIHFRANMDFWDPLLLATLSQKRPVIIFDQRGIGRTSGDVPDSYRGWADDLLSFIEALGLKEIDLLGFSMGGIVVQIVALIAPDSRLIRKLICAGTSAPVPIPDDHACGVVRPRQKADGKYMQALSTSNTQDEDREALKYTFFYDTPHGRAAFEAYWRRLEERMAEPVILRLLDRDGGTKGQLTAAAGKEIRGNGSDSISRLFERPGELDMPVLVANGDDDLLIPSSRSWELYKWFPNSQLIMYPKAGHGFLWQYAELFGRHVNIFLDGVEYDDGLASKL